jgi:hypothetical protein
MVRNAQRSRMKITAGNALEKHPMANKCKPRKGGKRY